MPDGGRAPARMRVLLAAAIVILVIAVLGRGVGDRGEGAVVLDVPPAGQAAPAELPDGTPVFVSHAPDGGVHVVEAINPHRYWGLTNLVGWCAPAGGFEAGLDGSRFDAAGRWLFGPAPHDLPTYTATRNGDVVLVGERKEPATRSPARDPAVRQWCVDSSGAIDAGVWTFGRQITPLVVHSADATAELLGLPGEPVQWCDGIVASDPPRCAQTLATIPWARFEGDFAWSWEGPVRGSSRAPRSLQLLAAGQEEYPARGTLARVFGRVHRLRTVAGTLRLVMNRKIIFGDFFTTARPLELGEPVPRLWKMGDRDGPVQATYALPEGFDESEAREFVGKLVDMVVADDSRILRIEPVPRGRR